MNSPEVLSFIEDRSEPKSETETSVKDDPEVVAISERVVKKRSKNPQQDDRIKAEMLDEENVTIDLTLLPEALHAEGMFDDVDGAEVVDLTYEGIAEIDGVDHFVCEDFKIPQIPKPAIVTRPLQSLHDNIESGHILLDPEYQREVVWDEGRASLLITSILMGYFIPPIIFNVKSHQVDDGNGGKRMTYIRICVDGKQRLTSVHKFMNGQIGFFDSNTPQKKWYFRHPVFNGQEGYSNHNILPNAVKAHFLKQAFCCYEYTDLKVDTEETMFQLVQRGIALTPAEKMRAMSTEWANFTKQYEDDYTLIVNLSKQSRASGFRLVLTIFTMIQEILSGKRKRSSCPTLQASPQSLLKVLEDKAPIPDALKLRYKAIFDRYENLVKISSTQITATRFKVDQNSVFDPAPDFLRQAGVEHVRTFSPLELIATAILVAINMDTRSDPELIDDVKAMRYYLRIKHKDLRVNAQCWITVWEFVTDEMNRRRAGQPYLNFGINGFPFIAPTNLRVVAGTYLSPYATVGDGMLAEEETSVMFGDSSSELSSPGVTTPDVSSDEDESEEHESNSDAFRGPAKRAPRKLIPKNKGSVGGKSKSKSKPKDSGKAPAKLKGRRSATGSPKTIRTAAKRLLNGTKPMKMSVVTQRTKKNSRPIVKVSGKRVGNAVEKRERAAKRVRRE
ncbi:hypothetical protein BGZ60DRAFT_523515 [Tricladium varicosporioides]|nr:hypothetical protein BGZ60DRAFT_523515 [Hymenoscyphus varicosporioides]